MKINLCTTYRNMDLGMHYFHILVVLVAFLKYGLSTDCRTEPRCHISRVYGMRAADCSSKNFKHFPQCISSSIEVIDLAMNRINKLSRSDLKRYTHLKALYLQENIIVKIDNDTFEGLDDLTGLDLSGAIYLKIPQNIFHLPSLQTLYLSQQMNSNVIEAIEAEPISCPLKQLDISYSEITRLPYMGLLPTLIKYNISGNNLKELGVDRFSGLCGLKYVITENVTLSLSKPCECWNTNRWLVSKGLKTPPFDCQLKEDLCEEVPFNASDIKNYEDCEILMADIERRSLIKKVVLPTLAILALIFLCAFLYIRRRKKNQQPPSYRIAAEEESNTLPLKNCAGS